MAMKKMQMQIFGDFVLSSPDASINEKMLHSNKLVRLLVYILMNREKDLTHQELIDTFWQDDGSRNPEGALKNLVYRLRTELRVFGREELIQTLPGIYRWNEDVKVETDYEEMERLARAGELERNPKKKRELCERALTLYSNKVTPRIASESWMVSRLTYYRLLYVKMVKALSQLYEEEQEWDLLEKLCLEALEVDNLEEDIHYWLIRSEIGKKNYEMAIQYYENARKLFYDNLGLRDVERFDQIYDEIMEISNNRMSDIASLMNSVSEKERPKSVFFCEYPVFREIYRVEARRICRTGIAEYLLLITMKKNSGITRTTMDGSMKMGMKILAEQLQETLRTGDVVARYSSTQYVLLLPTCTYEAAQQVAGRIEKRFHQAAGKRRLSLIFEVQELLAAESLQSREG